MDEVSSRTNRLEIAIVTGSSNTTLSSSLLRLARRLQMELVIQEITERQMEAMRADGPGLKTLLVDDIPVRRSRDWHDWDTVPLTASCAYYESENDALVQARRDCLHGVMHRERARRVRQLNVSWVRYSARRGVRHERLRQRRGGVAI